MKKSMYLGRFQNKILFKNKFLFLFCPLLKYFCLPILLSMILDQNAFYNVPRDIFRIPHAYYLIKIGPLVLK
jgi:putative lipase involved disintegration of autophagic bodies